MARAYPERTWTYEDLLALPDDGKRYEIIGGELYEMPGPNGEHAAAVVNLIVLLAPFVQALRGALRTAPIDAFMPLGTPVQPDVLVVLPGGAARLVRRGVEGAPDLVVEVLSPSNRAYDTLLKRSLYAAAGVREYWIVDPEARTVEVLTLHQDALHRAGLYAGDDPIASPLLPDVAFSAADVFAGLDEIAED